MLQKRKSYGVRSTWLVWEGSMRSEYEGYKWSKARIVSGVWRGGEWSDKVRIASGNHHTGLNPSHQRRDAATKRDHTRPHKTRKSDPIWREGWGKSTKSMEGWSMTRQGQQDKGTETKSPLKCVYDRSFNWFLCSLWCGPHTDLVCVCVPDICSKCPNIVDHLFICKYI